MFFHHIEIIERKLLKVFIIRDKSQNVTNLLIHSKSILSNVIR